MPPTRQGPARRRVGDRVHRHGRVGRRQRAGSSTRTARSGPTWSGEADRCASRTPSRWSTPSFYLPWPGRPKRPATTGWSCPTASATPRSPTPPYPFSPDHTAGVPRGQAVHRAVLAHPGHGRGDRAPPLHHLRPEAPDPPPLAGGQAGHLGGRDDRQPPGPRAWAPARGRRTTSCATCPGRVGARAWTRRSPSCAASRPAATSSTTARSTTCRRSRSARPPSDPLPILIGGHATPPHCVGPPDRTAGCTAGETPPTCPGCSSGCGQLREEEGTADRPFEVHVISFDAYTVDGIRRLEDQGVTDVIVGFRWPYAVGAGHRDAADQGRQPAPFRRRRHRQGPCDDRPPGNWPRPPWPPWRPGPTGVAGPVRRRRRGGGPDRPLGLRPRGQGPSRCRGHRGVLRLRHRRQRVDPVRHPPVVSCAATRWPTSGSSASPSPVARRSRSTGLHLPSLARRQDRLAPGYWEPDAVRTVS